MELMFVSTVFASVSQILLKKSAIKQYDHWLKAYLNPLVIVAYTLLGLSVIFNILAFRDIHYKWGPVIASLSYVFVPIASFFIFKENEC